jgi:urea transport system ATP-binding protein
MMLELSSVCSGYGRVRIINDVSLTVSPGEIVAVIGRNGVGKTTLMKTIIGEVQTHSGTVMFRKQDVTALPTSARAKLGIGYVPQGRGIFSRLTVGANLALGTGVGTASQPNLERAFEFFPILKKRLRQPAGSMSGGEQQQLAIGRILVGEPDIMLLDEPSEGIQPSIVQEIGRTVRLLSRQQGLTVVIVEQNLSLIQAVADRCVVIDNGAVIATLAPDELDDPETAKTYLAI